MDRITPEQRSALMKRVKVKNTRPELEVRSIIFAMGYRYRLHSKSLPGKPDIVFPGRKKVIFVHGCFWHGHRVCRRGQPPASNTDYWISKIEANRERDKRKCNELRRAGWKVMTIWECQLKNPEKIALRVRAFLDAK